MGRGSGCSGPPRIQQFSLAASEEPTWAEAAGKRRISTEDPELAADMFLNTVLGRASRVRTHPRARTCHECVTNRSRGVRVSCVQVWSKRPCNPWTTRSAQVVTPMSQVRSVTHVSGPDLGKGGCGGKIYSSTYRRAEDVRMKRFSQPALFASELRNPLGRRTTVPLAGPVCARPLVLNQALNLSDIIRSIYIL